MTAVQSAFEHLGRNTPVRPADARAVMATDLVVIVFGQFSAPGGGLPCVPERVEVCPAPIQTNAPPIPAEPFRIVTGPAPATVRPDLREHLRSLEGRERVEEAQCDDRLMQGYRPNRLTVLDGLGVLNVVIRGTNAQTPNAFALDQIVPVQLAKLAGPETMIEASTGSQYAPSPPPAMNRFDSVNTGDANSFRRSSRSHSCRWFVLARLGFSRTIFANGFAVV
jgi:hypothetical protein